MRAISPHGDDHAKPDRIVTERLHDGKDHRQVVITIEKSSMKVRSAVDCNVSRLRLLLALPPGHLHDDKLDTARACAFVFEAICS